MFACPVFALLFAVRTVSATSFNIPIIGILLEEVYSDHLSFNCSGQYGVYSDYVWLLQQSGALVIPLFINQSDQYYDQIIKRINGIVLPGGGQDIVKSFYGQTSYKIFKMASKMNDAGNYFPILGICLGMQEMTTWPFLPRTNVLSNCTGTYGASLPLNFTKSASFSKLFQSFPQFLMNALSKENLTPNYHHYGLAMKTYLTSPELSSFFDVLSTNTDAAGLEFVSTFQAHQYPFYGVQWHPEKISYWRRPNDTINHSNNALLVSQYVSNFFVSEASKSKQSFHSIDELGRFVINTYPMTFVGKLFQNLYCFNDTDVPSFDPS